MSENGALRSALIGYGALALTVLVARSGLPADSSAAGGSAVALVALGLGVQFAVVALRALIRRRAASAESATQALGLVELLGDGITVLLFAMATYGAIVRAPLNI